jgi:Fe2+ transport system protein B
VVKPQVCSHLLTRTPSGRSPAVSSERSIEPKLKTGTVTVCVTMLTVLCGVVIPVTAVLAAAFAHVLGQSIATAFFESLAVASLVVQWVL